MIPSFSHPMCGINGFNWEDKELLLRMNKAISHRGPDQHGIFLDQGISLGHQRLSIIDLSEAGKQPMCNEDQTIWITFGGEIYNYKEIKAPLERKGHKFTSKTDTEVIIHAYEEYGFDCVKQFNGMFAFALYDTKRKILFIARDRLGIKPLYYYVKGRKIIFSSEIKALLAHPSVERKINPKALHDFLSFRAVTIPDSMIEGVRKLEPGSYLVFYNHDSLDPEKSYQAVITKYWTLTMKPEQANEEHQARMVLSLLRQSIRRQLMSDVPLGVYLSGGIDSGALVALMKPMVSEPINTFTVGFGLEEHKDEISKAQFIVDHFKTNHHPITVKADAATLLPKLVWHMDEPMSDATSIPTYLLSQETKKHCTVVLTGEGSDEVFGGYVQYKIMKLHEKYLRARSTAVRKGLYSIATATPTIILNKIFKYTEGLGKEGMKRYHHFLHTNDYGEQYLDLVSIFSEDEKKELFALQHQYLISQQQLVSRMNRYFTNQNDLLNNLLMLETEVILVDDLLMKMDKNTMAFGVEARVPFLDHHLVEYGATLPASLKLRGNTEKYILRRAMKGILPSYTLKQKKERFFVPIHYWFQGELKAMAQQMFSEKNVKEAGYFNYEYIHKLFTHFNDSKIFYGRQLWSLLIFELWRKIYIEQETLAAPMKKLEGYVY